MGVITAMKWVNALKCKVTEKQGVYFSGSCRKYPFNED